MKNFFIAAAFILAAATLAAPSAKSQYTSGDLLLGISGTVSSDYVIDLGPSTNFEGKGVEGESAFTEILNLGNINTDLTSIFGSGWETNPSISWGIAGVSPTLGDSYLLASRSESVIGDPGVGYTVAGTHTQNQAGTLIDNVGLDNGNTYSSTAANAFTQSSTDTSSWAANLPPTLLTPFNYFSGDFLGTDPTNGISATALDLFSMPPGNSGAKGNYDGTFKISNTGVVTFSVIPEPSTYASIALGAGLMLILRRRRCA